MPSADSVRASPCAAERVSCMATRGSTQRRSSAAGGGKDDAPGLAFAGISQADDVRSREREHSRLIARRQDPAQTTTKNRPRHFGASVSPAHGRRAIPKGALSRRTARRRRSAGPLRADRQCSGPVLRRRRSAALFPRPWVAEHVAASAQIRAVARPGASRPSDERSSLADQERFAARRRRAVAVGDAHALPRLRPFSADPRSPPRPSRPSDERSSFAERERFAARRRRPVAVGDADALARLRPFSAAPRCRPLPHGPAMSVRASERERFAARRRGAVAVGHAHALPRLRPFSAAPRRSQKCSPCGYTGALAPCDGGSPLSAQACSASDLQLRGGRAPLRGTSAAQLSRDTCPAVENPREAVPRPA